MAERYKFDHGFQARILALMLKDPSFVHGYRDVLQPVYFDSQTLASLARVLFDYYDAYQDIPDRLSFRQATEQDCLKYRRSPEEGAELIGTVDVLYDMAVPNPEYVIEETVKFGKHQEVKDAMLRGVELLRQGEDNHDEILRIMGEAVLKGTNTLQLGTDVSSNLMRIQAIIQRSRDQGRRVPTLFPTLDKNTFGGPSRGEVWVAVGQPGGGKSAFLVNIAAAAVKQGYPVVYYTIGDMSEDDVFFRIAARLTGISMSAITKGSMDYATRAAKLMEKGFYLRAKYYPSKVPSIETIRSHLMRLQAVDQVKPACVIIDYADELRHGHDDNDYVGVGETYSGMNQIANDFKAVVWTGSQPQRLIPLKKNEVLRQTHMGDSWRKAQKADGIITINQTPEEYDEMRARIWIEKVRRGRKFKLFHVDTWFDRMWIRERAEGAPAETY